MGITYVSTIWYIRVINNHTNSFHILIKFPLENLKSACLYWVQADLQNNEYFKLFLQWTENRFNKPQIQVISYTVGIFSCHMFSAEK